MIQYHIISIDIPAIRWEKPLLQIFSFLFCLILLPAAAVSDDAPSRSTPYGAGFSRISVTDKDGAFDTMIWYPISGSENPWEAGPFTVAATPNADIAEGWHFPLVLLSHGSGGTPLAHRELAASLARNGFVVVAPLHLGDAAGRPRTTQRAKVLMARPRQAQEALGAFLKDKRFTDHVDPDRLGMVGYSAGGYTGLVLAGARPNFPMASAYCVGEGRNDIGSCGPTEREPSQPDPTLKDWQAPTEARIKALVLMDPLSMLFDRAGLEAVKLPVMLLRPENDAYLHASHNALALSRDLPSRPESVTVPGQHFVFIDPCPAELLTEAPAICQDSVGIDRTAIHREIETGIARFLHQNL